MNLVLTNPTAEEVASKLSEMLDAANQGAKARTLRLSVKALAVTAATPSGVMDYAVDGGGVCNSYKSAAFTTAARVVAVTVGSDRLVGIAASRPYAKKGAYGNVSTVILPVCDKDIEIPRKLRPNTKTTVLAALGLLKSPFLSPRGTYVDEYAVKAAVANIGDEAKAAGHLFASRWQNTAAPYLLDGDLYAVGDHRGIVTRFAFRGEIVKVGVAVKLPDIDGSAGTYWEHGSSLKACRNARQEKIDAARLAEAKASPRVQRAARLIARLCGELPVTRRHAKAIGYCDAGIASFCDAHGIAESAESVPAKVLVSDARSRRVVEAAALECAAKRFA